MKQFLIFLFVGMLVLMNSCVSLGRFRREEAEKNRFQERVDKMSQKRDDLEVRLLSEENEREGLEDELEAARKKRAEEVKRLNETYRDLVKDMESEIQKGEIEITNLKGKLSVNIVDKIIFPTGKAELSGAGKKVLARVGKILKEVTGRRIQINGHTDNVSIGPAIRKKFPTNWELSTARATTVARYLIDTADVAPVLISVAGFAEFKPVAPNDTKKGRAKNRRIEIVLVPIPIDEQQNDQKPAAEEKQE